MDGFVTTTVYIVGAFLVVASFADLVLDRFHKAKSFVGWLYRSGGRRRKMHRVLTSPGGRLAVLCAGLAVIYYATSRREDAVQAVPTQAKPLIASEIATEVARAILRPEPLELDQKTIDQITETLRRTEPRKEAPVVMVALYERDSESWFWRGERYKLGGFRLDETARLETGPVGAVQRFNPAVLSPVEALSNTILFVALPDYFEVQPSRA